jgi:hypothetical protein
MRHRIEHSLEPARARQIVAAALVRYALRYARYKPHLTWLDRWRAAFAFEVRGLRVEGQLVFEPGALAVHAELPWALRPFRGRAVRLLEEQARRVLGEGTGASVAP